MDELVPVVSTLDDAWKFIIRQIIAIPDDDEEHTYKVARGSFAGQYRKELPFIALKIENPGIRPLAPYIPLWAPNVHPPTDDDRIEKYLNILVSPLKPNKRMAYHYGEWIWKQLFVAIEYYKWVFVTTGSYITNQMCMRLGDQDTIGKYLEATRTGEEVHTPCLVIVDTAIRKINGVWTLIFYCVLRSWDGWGGFSENLGGLQLMKEFMAEEIGVADGPMYVTSKGLHLYDHAWPWAAQIVSGYREVDTKEVGVQ